MRDGDDVFAARSENSGTVVWARVFQAGQRQVGMKRPPLEYDAEGGDAIGQLPLKGHGLRFARRSSNPQHVGRAARRECTDTAEGEIERRLRDRLTNRLDNR